MKIPFSPPYIDESVISEVVDALRSGWITTGPKVKALEAEIAKLNESKAVLGVNSWTSGAIMVLRWLGIQPGDEVIIPAYTDCATAMAVEWAGGKVVMVDSGDDFNISVEAIRKAITPRTKAIIPVDIAGFPCDYEAIMNEKKYSLYLNELWQKWRVLYQSSKGASKDSEIPNWIYNDYRNVCCSTILSYIEGHPNDIKAINEFLVMACKENILRYGEFEYGNQYAVEKYYLFPEIYSDNKE